LGDVGGFASGGGAEVEDGFAGAGLEKFGREEGAWILEIKEAGLKTREGGEGGMFGEFEDEGGPIELAGFEFDAFVLPGGGERIDISAECVRAREGGRSGVV
jgi:hypothetical protein